MRKTYRYRLYPSKAQMSRLGDTLESCRWVYNETVALRKTSWETNEESISLYTTNKELTQWKKDKQELKQVHSQVLQNVQVRVDLAYKAFFRRIKSGETPGYPRFKGKGRYDSFTYPQSGFEIIDDRTIKVSKIGEIKAKIHRAVIGNVKTATIRRYPTGKWYVCFSTECDLMPEPHKNDNAIGIDVGISKFATLSNGSYIPNPRWVKQEEKSLAKAQRKMSSFAMGSDGWLKSLKVVQRIYERTSNRRKDFTHKLSRSLVDNYGIIVFEDLNIKDMVQNNHLAKSIMDVAWRMLIDTIKNKAECASSKVVLVNPAYTSQMCSRCGTIVKKELKDRIHKCNCCNLEMDRDLNASINILRLGLQSLG